ncbi:hypothetical protein [Streptomyces abikoensis]
MSATLFQRHPALLAAVDGLGGRRQIAVSVWDGEPAVVVDDPRLLAAVSHLPREVFTRAEALGLWAKAGLGDVAEPLWTYCTAEACLIVPDGDGGRLRHAGYHGATRKYPFLDMGRLAAFAEDAQLMRDYLASDAYPPVYTSLPHLARVPLSRADLALNRDKATVADQLAMLIDGTFGERARRGAADDGESLQLEVVFKAIPSGGARHPTEALLYLRADGMPAGLYHFCVADRTLDQLTVQPSPSLLCEACPGLARLLARPCEAVAVVMLACDVRRAMWRYRDPRSFRAVVVDAGHAVQHLAEMASWLGWTWTDVPGADVRALAGHMGLDSESMPVLSVGVLQK